MISVNTTSSIPTNKYLFICYVLRISLTESKSALMLLVCLTPFTFTFTFTFALTLTLTNL